MRMRIKLLGLVIVAALFVMLGGDVTHAAAYQYADTQLQTTLPTSFEWTNLSVGDIVGQGQTDREGNCEYSDFEIITPVSLDGEERWIVVEFDPSNCQARVAAKWTGPFEEGPVDIIQPAELDQTLPLSQSQPVAPLLSAGRKTAAMKTYIYSGFQGTLTSIEVSLTWDYDGYGNAWTYSDSKTCYANGGALYQEISCSWATRVTSGSEVRSKGDGYFRRYDNAYPHHLYADVRGDGYGYGTCIGSYSGWKPPDPLYYSYIQGCS